MIEGLREMVRNWVKDGDEQKVRFTEMSGQDIEENVVAKTISFVESSDDKLPVVGAYMDLPIIDALQAKAIRILVKSFVRRIYGEYRYEQAIEEAKQDEEADT